MEPHDRGNTENDHGEGGRQHDHTARRGARHASQTSGNSVVAAVCFASVATASVAPAAAGRRRTPSTIAAVINGSMNTSKFVAWASWGRNAVAASR